MAPNSAHLELLIDTRGLLLKYFQKRLADDSQLQEAFTKGRMEGLLSVRRAQMRLLEGEDSRAAATMAVWLGKNLLGQSDRSILETKWQGRLENIPDAELMKLAKLAMDVIAAEAAIPRLLPAPAEEIEESPSE